MKKGKLIVVAGILCCVLFLNTCSLNGDIEELREKVSYRVTFDSNGGSAVASQLVSREGGKAKEPNDPVKYASAGLYQSPRPTYSFDGWLKDGVPWDFDLNTVPSDITLVADWTVQNDKLPIGISAQTGSNVVAKAVNYIKTNIGQYFLLLDEDISCEPQELINTNSASSLTLTMIGMYRERKISSPQNGPLFSLSGYGGSTNSCEIVLGDKITLVGRLNNDFPLVKLSAGTLRMEEGSKITGNRSPCAAVDVDGSGFLFMTGGTITGNEAVYDSSVPDSIYAPGGARITYLNMSGSSSISGNTGPAGDVYCGTARIFFNDDAEIGKLTRSFDPYMINATYFSLTGWTGKISRLNLTGTNGSDWVSYYNMIWSDNCLDNINRITLGDFFDITTGNTKAIGSPDPGNSAPNGYQLISTVTTYPQGNIRLAIK